MAKTINTILNLTDKFTPKLTTAKKEALIFRQQLKNCNLAASKIDSGLAKAAKTAVAMGAAGAASIAAFGVTCTKAYNEQLEAETKLNTVMKQRMKATTAEIDSVKKLASSQQRLGVVGDEVQLAGAQQLSTFLNTSSALKMLLPAMNNLAVQQNGVNVTSENMVSLGNMMGKVMQGQTSALKRVGITFTEAQEQALKYGDEQQRAATLAQVITDNVGEMNAALAANPEGKLKQITNDFGDMQEVLGAKVQPYLMEFFDYIHEALPEAQEHLGNFLDRTLPKAADMAKKGLERLKPIVKFTVEHFSELTRVGIGLVTGLKAFSILTRATTYYKKFEGTLKGVTTAQKLATVAQTAFSASLLASPITWIAVGIGSITAAYLAFKKHLEKKDIEKHFGDITLSAKECSNIVKGVFGSEAIDKVDEASNAYDEFSDSLKAAGDSAAKLNKLNFKIEFGGKVEGEDYLSAVDQYVKDIQAAAQDKQYSLRLNMSLLFAGTEGGSGLSDKLNGYMTEFTAEGTKLGNALSTAAQEYVESNFNPDFKGPLEKAYKDMQAYQEKLSIAQSEAKLETLKLDFASGDLSKESFEQLIEATNEEISKMQEVYTQARVDAITAAKMQFSEGSEELTNAVEEADTAFRQHMSELTGKGLQFETGAIMEAYKPEFQSAFDQFGQDIDFTGFYDSIATELANGGSVNWDDINQRLFDDYSVSAEEAIAKASRKNIGKLFELIKPTSDDLSKITEGMEAIPETAANALIAADVVGAAAGKTRTFKAKGFIDILKTLEGSDKAGLTAGANSVAGEYSRGLVTPENLKAAENAAKKFKDKIKDTLSEAMTITIPVTVTATPTVDGGRPTAEKTDSNAVGTAYFGGGWTRVNENGGEIMDLPTGTRIIPADKSEKMVKQNPSVNVTVQVQGNIFGLENAADLLGNIICGKVVEAINAV